MWLCSWRCDMQSIRIEYKYGRICNGKSVNNMKTIISVLFVSVLAGSYAFTGGRTDFKTGDTQVLQKQKALFELLQHPYQPGVSIYKPEYLSIVQSFNFEQSYDHFNNVEAVKEFYYLYKKGLMPFNELFSIYNEYHRRQAISLFHVFYYAKGITVFLILLLFFKFSILNYERFSHLKHFEFEIIRLLVTQNVSECDGFLFFN